MRIKTKLILGGALALASCITGVGGFSNDTYAAYDAEGIPANEAFTDNVFYGAVVDSYNIEKYKQEHDGSSDGFWENYDKESERQKKLTEQQLASIKVFRGYNCPVVASQAQSIKSFDGLELLTGLQDFDSGVCQLDVPYISFANNLELRSFYNPENMRSMTIDFTKNLLLEKIFILASYNGVEMPEILLPDGGNLTNIYMTSFDAGQLSNSIHIMANIPTYESDELGLGGDGDTVDAQYKLNLGRLGFFYDSSTANYDSAVSYKKEDLTDEQFVVDPNQNCYSLNADAKILSIKESCIENGKITVGLTHKYKIDGNQVSARFEATINFVDVYAINFVDGAMGELNDIRSKKIALGDFLNTNDYLSAKFHTGLDDDERASFPKDSEYELKGVKVVYATVPISSIKIKSYADTGLTNRDMKYQNESLTTSNLGKIDDESIKTIMIMYNYTKASGDEESVKVPDTGFFTNEDGGLNVVNTLLVLAGLSVAGALGIYAYRRISGRVKAHRF